jgi:hypothetical protein
MRSFTTKNLPNPNIYLFFYIMPIEIIIATSTTMRVRENITLIHDNKNKPSGGMLLSNFTP